MTEKKRTNSQLTGMEGVYLVAAELSANGYIASPTSRGAVAADVLATKESCDIMHAIQVKTNKKANNFWLLSAKCKSIVGENYFYALVNLKSHRREKGHREFPDIYVVPSGYVAKNAIVSDRKNSTWYSISLAKVEKFKDNWDFQVKPSRVSVSVD